MKGLVKIIKNGELWEESSNMILDGMGYNMAEAMTASPSWASGISSSSILDASNYTIQAMSFGKDTKGYYNHAHNLPDMIVAASVTDHIIRVKTASGYTSSSYISSHVTTYSKNFDSQEGLRAEENDLYNLLPEFSNPIQTKLEEGYKGLRVTVGDADREHIGHNLNKLWVPTEQVDLDIPASRELYGCYPSASGTKYYILSSWENPDTDISEPYIVGFQSSAQPHGASGIAYSTFNYLSAMDRNGFLKLAVSSANAGRDIPGVAPFYYGSISGIALYAQDDFSSTGRVQYISTVSGGDLLFAGLFGGIYTLGLWTIDIKETIKNGESPPFNFNYLDNKIKYRLVARKTFTRDLTYIQDYTAAAKPFSGYKFLEDRVGGAVAGNNHLVIQWELAL